jgi:hypothetical protein
MCALTSALLQLPELAITKEEADALSAATADVLDEYELMPTGRMGAWGGLAMVLVPMLGMRYRMFRIRMHEEREALRAGLMGAGHAMAS